MVPDLQVSGPNVAAEHARVWKDEAGDCWVQDLPGSSGTWVNGKLIHKGDKIRLMPQVRTWCWRADVCCAVQLQELGVDLCWCVNCSCYGHSPAASELLVRQNMQHDAALADPCVCWCCAV